MSQRTKVLFVAEDVTLAQVVRLVTLAKFLPIDRYEIFFACSNFEPLVFEDTNLERRSIFTVDRKKVFKSLRSGKRLYEYGLLKKYAEEECQLLDEIKPDVVVGDFRLSLSASAPSKGIPLVTLINAYWSPFARRPNGWPMPEHPIVRMLGVEMASKHFPKALPTVFKHFAKPVNRLRRKYQLPAIGSLAQVLTYGDATIFPDIAELIPTKGLPKENQFLGFVDWSPASPPPESWAEIPADATTIYVTLGSSGQVDNLPAVLDGLKDLPVHVIVATAGRVSLDKLPKNFHVSDYVPGAGACKRANLVISNGGSSTGYQSLGQGTPVLGIADNLDQYLAMTAIEEAGAGKLLRSGLTTKESVREAVSAMLGDAEMNNAARQIALKNSKYNPSETFMKTLDRVSSNPASATAEPLAS